MAIRPTIAIDAHRQDVDVLAVDDRALELDRRVARAKSLPLHIYDLRRAAPDSSVEASHGPALSAERLCTVDLVRELGADVLDAMARDASVTNADVGAGLNVLAERVSKMRSGHPAAVFQVGHLVVLTRRVPETRAAAARALMRVAPELCAAIVAAAAEVSR